MDEQRVPTWRLREELRRRANEIVEGRASFERHTGRLSTKPLQRIDLDPREVLQLLDALDEAERRPPEEALLDLVARAICGADGKVNWTEHIPAKYKDLAEAALAAMKGQKK